MQTSFCSKIVVVTANFFSATYMRQFFAMSDDHKNIDKYLKGSKLLECLKP